MKRNRLFTAITLAAALAMTACTQDELADNNMLPEGMYPLEIASVTLAVESSEQPWTRVRENADGTGSTFFYGDTITVSLNGENATYTYNGSTWTSDAPLYWRDTQMSTITAWYASPEETDGTISLADQSSGLAYVLSGTGNGIYNTPVTLTFTHSLAKVQVRFTGGNAHKVADVKIKSYTSCTHNQGTVSTEGASEGWITMHKATYNDATCWEANVVPGYQITKFKVNGTEGTLDNGGITPEAGKLHKITLSVKPITIEDGNTISEPGDYILTGTISQGVTLTNNDIRLTLKDVTSNISGSKSSTVTVNGCTPAIIIEGSNTLSSTGAYTGGINAINNGNIVIEGSGTLTINATGTENTAIGARRDGPYACGNITIRGITLNIENSAVGIGGAPNAGCGNITIENATVNVAGGPAIGASNSGYTGVNTVCGDITITNTNLTATGNGSSVAIGCGNLSNGAGNTCGNITIVNTGKTESEILSTINGDSGAKKIGKGSGGTSTCGTVTITSSDGTSTYPDGVPD